MVGVLLAVAAAIANAQQPLSWDEVKARFEAMNPALKADAAGVDEMRAAEITASLRPNPQLGATVDGSQIARHNGVWQPMAGTFVSPNLSYLHEREHKRELRLQSAQQGTGIAGTEHEDLKRNLEFGLRMAFVATLQAKAVVQAAKADLDYYDKVIAISRARFHAGDLAQIDLDRIELGRVQYEAELQAALVGLQTAKIQLLQLLDARTPVQDFDVAGSYEFSDVLPELEQFHQAALDARPDLAAALATIIQAETNHKLAVANGSTDPTFSGWYTWNSSTNNPNATQTVGASVSIPLRIFDRNQGEKQRTQIDVDRSRQTSKAVRAQVFADVDSAYALVASTITQLRPYKSQYNQQAIKVRETVTYSYEHGGASLMDFLNAESEYRQVELAYLELIGSYLSAAGQLNLAVGKDVLHY
jgi:cobalt-zinc-cadmium efflux system outer membrane protein